MVEGGNAFTLPYVDVVTNMALESSQYVKASESIPFMGMVLHGSKVLTGTPANMEGDINEAILHAIENGAGMYFILSYQNTAELKENFRLSKYYSVNYDIWKNDLAEYYTTLNEATKDLQTSYIVDHEFLDADRIPDADELEADAIAAAEEAAKLAEEEAAKLAEEERERLFEERMAQLAGGIVAEETEAETEEPEEEEETEELADGVTLNEFGEEIVEEEEEEEVVLDKYKTVSGTVVRVEYEGGVNFILNYNSYAITVEYDGQTYEIAGLDFVRID